VLPSVVSEVRAKRLFYPYKISNTPHNLLKNVRKMWTSFPTFVTECVYSGVHYLCSQYSGVHLCSQQQTNSRKAYYSGVLFLCQILVFCGSSVMMCSSVNIRRTCMRVYSTRSCVRYTILEFCFCAQILAEDCFLRGGGGVIQ
jgi:hypothetical protein